MSSINIKYQSGIVSIMVTMVMMIVISLVVLGFAEISRTEQTNSLNDQLSVQAYYAAESGVNDARADMTSDLQQNKTLQQNSTCNPSADDPTLYPDVGGSSASLNSGANVRYTCVMINPNPSQLVYDVGYTSTVVPISATSGSSLGSLTLQWSPSTGSPDLASSCTTAKGTFPSADNWGCPYPVLRIDLVADNGSLARADWGNDTSTMFFEPAYSNSSNPPTSTPFGSKGGSFSAQCDNQYCTVVISSLGDEQYYMRITTIYSSDSALTIASPGNTFSDAQATIDSTGQAQDTLRRIKVAIDLTDANSYTIPSAALITEDSVCKRFEVTNGFFEIPSDSSIPSGSGTMCTPYSSGAPKP